MKLKKQKRLEQKKIGIKSAENVPTKVQKKKKISSDPKDEAILKKAIEKPIKKKAETTTQKQPAIENGSAAAQNGEETKKKKRKRHRPWRQVIRHKAKRERLALENGEEGAGKEQDTTSETQAGKPKKRKQSQERAEKEEETTSQIQAEKPKKIKRSKKKRLKEKAKLMATENEENEPKSPKEKAYQNDRLDAARFRYLNEQLYTKPSTSAVELFKEDPNAFEVYHRGYKQQLKKWPANPLHTILLDLSTLRAGSVIADLGCGEAELARKLGANYTVHSFDLVAANERVVAADMADLPLKKASVDVCVYCLSLMGTNLAHFFREAHRVLKMGGKLKIAEVASRFQNVKNFITALGKMGFQLKRKKEIGDGFFIILTLQKTGRFENKRPQGLQLQPCLYKKR